MRNPHPNRLPFEGVLTVVDHPSDKAPSGARGHRVRLTRAAAETALPSLVGMAVDFRAGWDGHDARRKIGVIGDAFLQGDLLMVRGYLYARDFPEAVQSMQQQDQGPMGMSFELADARVEDIRAELWTLTRVTFTGAAILLTQHAAYRTTTFVIGKGINENLSETWGADIVSGLRATLD